MKSVKTGLIYEGLQELFRTAPEIPLTGESKMVIFSDTHLGNGGRQDDFLHNSSIFTRVLKQYYLKNGFSLILNGDIEELQRFNLGRIQKQWSDVYSIFQEFRDTTGLYKIVGNHDDELHSYQDQDNLLSALKLRYQDKHIFIFHGNQATGYTQKYSRLIGFILKYLANPLGIKNKTASNDSLKKYKIEKRVYQFSSENKIISIIGHTHRPLFESVSKIDHERYSLEQLLREYLHASTSEKPQIEERIQFHKQELHRLYKKDKKNNTRSGIYKTDIIIPCLFNSGCVIGKRGITGLELTGDSISLVHWFDIHKSQKYMSYEEDIPQQLGDSSVYRVVLNEDNLDYIFARIRLLS